MDLKTKALKLGATEFAKSTNKNKKYYVIYKGKKIHFGHSFYEDFLTHKDPERRRRYLARAKKITDGNGKLTWKNKNKANFWAIRILWS
tara:strand:- start:182 stop:448 length:267 start_codon:yes stop_codon:yes gene_type:complete